MDILNSQLTFVAFYVHADKGWVGASPDAHVLDPVTSTASRIAEFKCPFSKADVRVETACEDPLFTLTGDKRIRLDRTHAYYQVQLQLYTSGAAWYDFSVYTRTWPLKGSIPMMRGF